MGVDAPAARLDQREQRINAAIGRWTPFLGLAIGTVLTPLALPATVDFWLGTGALVLVTALWSYLLAGRRVPGAELCDGPAVRAGIDPRVGAVYVVGLLVLSAALVYRSPLYGFLAFAGYMHSFLFLHGRWRWVGVAATAVIVAYSQLGGSFTEFTPLFAAGWAGLAVVNGVLAGGLTYLGVFTAEQSERRRRGIAELDAANRRLEESLAENAALHARLLAQAREAGVLDERARLAREIHDTIAQGLTGIVTQLEAAGSGDPAVARRHIDTAAALARESLSEARRSVKALAPGRLAGARLSDAITEMAKTWAETAGIDVHVDTTGDPRPLLPDIEVTLFRVAQEGLANVGRHAHAARAALTLSYMDDVVVLDVRDDGIGFDGAVHPGGFGLAGMEQRVRRMSGTLAIESAPGEGTAISAALPAIQAEVAG